MRRAFKLWWTPLAVCCPHAAFPSSKLPKISSMPTANGLHRVILKPANCRKIVALLGTTADDASSMSRLHRARILLQRMSSASHASPSPRKNPATVLSVSRETDAGGIEEEAPVATSKQRALSRYIPSDYRGVQGGPKGKWKARIVSKGGLRQLGTFGCELDAARAYNRAAKALHGSAAKLNLLPDDETVGSETKNVTLAPGVIRVEDKGTKGAVFDALEGGRGETDERHAAPAVNADSGAYEGATIKSTATVVSSRLEDVGKETNTVTAQNTSSSLGGVGTADVDDNVEVYGVDAQSISTAGLANATAANFGVSVCAEVSAGNTVGGTQSGEMNLPRAEVSVIRNESPFLPELDFRDLEEIPVSTGPSLVDDSTWEAASSETDNLFSVENNRGGDSFSRSSGGDKVTLPLERELTPGLKNVAKAGNVSAEEVDVSDAPSSVLLQVDRLAVTSGLDDTKRLLAAAAMTDAPGEGPALSSSQSGSEPCSAEETGGSPKTLSALPDAELQTVSFGFDGPPSSRAREETDSLDVKVVAVSPPAVAASINHEGISGEGDVIELGADEGMGDSDCRDGDAWRPRAPVGIGGWAWDETGEDLYEEKLKGVVDVSTGLDRYWMDLLLRLTKPETRKVATQLANTNKLGYVSSRGGPVGKGSLLEFVLKQKEQHPTKVLLTRVGEFYETYGVDAVMMMQHAGLNRMGQEIRAGCPRKNVQQTLDGLTGAGLTVAVYEEVNDVDAQRGPSAKTRIKERFLSQVVSPGSPNYLYEGCLRTDDISFRESKPYVGVMKDSSGYLLCQIYPDEREVLVSERMTEEAVRVSIEEAGVAEPVFDQGTDLSFLPDHTEPLEGFPSAAFPGQVLARVARLLELSESDLEHFRTVTRTSEGRPRPVYPSTALQIGLLRNPNVPDLVPCLLPTGYPAACHRFLRKWLLLPPSYRLADSSHQLCRRLAMPEQAGLPPLHAVPVGKAKALLLDRQCNVPFFREIHQCVRGMLDMLGEKRGGGSSESANSDRGGYGSAGEGKYSALLPHLLDLVAYHSGVDAVEDHLRGRAKSIIRSIEDVVAPAEGSDDISSDPNGLVPESFLRCNEANFRGSLSLEHEVTRKAYRVLNEAASELCAAVKDDFPNAAQDLTFDFHNNGVYLTKRPASAKTAASTSTVAGNAEDGAPGVEVVKEQQQRGDGNGVGGESATTVFINPHDRNGKLLSKRFTTRRVSEAVSAYLTAVQETEGTVKLELQALSDSLVHSNDLPVIAQAAHWSVICQAMEGHVRRSLSSGWSLPNLKGPHDPDMSMQVENLVPYWLPRGEAMPNSFDFRGMFLLTAPNMSGKSTLMRSVLACSLLANAGLFVPCTSATVPRFDGFFLRTASYDIPAEDKSAFALEMDDVRVMLRDSSKRSLALVDELGKGTSARDGAALAGALLEEMDRVSITGIFATHLHELFDLPLKVDTLSYKRMGIDWEDGDNPKWTYTMEDGKCTNSLSLQTARKYNIPGSIIARAKALSAVFDDVCRGSSRSIESAGEREESPSWWPSEGRGWGGKSPGGFRTMTDATELVSKVIGRAEGDVISVDSSYGTPPSLEGRSCLYVLRYSAFVGTPGWGPPPQHATERKPSKSGAGGLGINEDGSAEAFSGSGLGSFSSPVSSFRGQEAGVWFYVGETDVIRKRLKQHARIWGGGTDSGRSSGACKLDAIVVDVGNRSEALRLETAVIRAMKEEGFYLVSDRDGSRTHFSSAGPDTSTSTPLIP